MLDREDMQQIPDMLSFYFETKSMEIRSCYVQSGFKREHVSVSDEELCSKRWNYLRSVTAVTNL